MRKPPPGPFWTRSSARLEPSIPRHNLTVLEIKKIRRSPATGRAAFWKSPETSWSTFSEIQNMVQKGLWRFAEQFAKYCGNLK